MVSSSNAERVLDTSALAGIFAGLGMLFPAFLDPGLSALAFPAVIVLIAGLLCAMR